MSSPLTKTRRVVFCGGVRRRPRGPVPRPGPMPWDHPRHPGRTAHQPPVQRRAEPSRAGPRRGRPSAEGGTTLPVPRQEMDPFPKRSPPLRVGPFLRSTLGDEAKRPTISSWGPLPFLPPFPASRTTLPVPVHAHRPPSRSGRPPRQPRERAREANNAGRARAAARHSPTKMARCGPARANAPDPTGPIRPRSAGGPGGPVGPPSPPEQHAAAEEPKETSRIGTARPQDLRISFCSSECSRSRGTAHPRGG